MSYGFLAQIKFLTTEITEDTEKKSTFLCVLCDLCGKNF
jgi:hypothetical protein